MALYSLLMLRAPRGRQAAGPGGWVSLELQSICCQSGGGRTVRLCDLSVSGLGIWDHTVGGIGASQVAVVGAQWVV